MRIRPIGYGVAMVALLVSACGGGSDTLTTANLTAGVIAERVGGGVRLQNGTTQPITYVVVNRGWLGQIASCASSTVSCATLAAGGGVVVGIDHIYGGNAGYFAESVVYYWPIQSGRAQEPVREIVVEMNATTTTNSPTPYSS